MLTGSPNSHGAAWLSSWRASSGLTTCSTASPTCSLHTGHGSTFVDNGPEFVARNVRQWLDRISVKTLFIEPGSPWENGYCESFNSKLRDELWRESSSRRCTRPRSSSSSGERTTMP